MSTIVTKFITDNAVTDLKARLRNTQPLRARNAANSADINILQVNASNLVDLLGIRTAFLNGTLQLFKSAIDPVAVAAVSGDVYYNTTSNLIKFYNGTSWLVVGINIDKSTE